MIKNMFKKIFDIKTSLNNTADLSTRNCYEADLQNHTLVCEKLDNKHHLTALIPYGVDDGGNPVFLTTNVTSNEKINLKLENKIDSKIKYCLKDDKITKCSYETPIFVNTLTENDLEKLNDCNYLSNDI